MIKDGTDYTREDVTLGKNVWYVITENTNVRVSVNEHAPIIFTSLDMASDVAQEVTTKTNTQQQVISVYDYNATFRRFMVVE